MPDVTPRPSEVVLSSVEARALIWTILKRERETGVEVTREELAAIRASFLEDPPLSRPRPVNNPAVYYFRVGNRIKIGFTVNVEGRVRNLMPEEVLGWEPGDRNLETKRHRQFAAYRVAREWFEDVPAIRRHIEENCQPHCS